MYDMVTRARLNDEAVMRQVERLFKEGNLAEVQAVIEANPDLAERIDSYLAQLEQEEWAYERGDLFADQLADSVAEGPLCRPSR